MQLAFEPYIPLAVWTPLAALAVVLLVAYAIASRERLRGARRIAALALMTCAVVLPLIILLNPTWIERLPPPAGKPLLTVLVDRTLSMATKDGTDGRARFAQAAQIARDVERQLGDRFEIEVKTFGATVAPIAGDELAQQTPDAETTDIAGALESSLADRPQGQAIMLLADGAHNAGGGSQRLRQTAEKAKAMATPIYTSTLGQQTGVRDLELSLNVAEELAFIDQDVPLTIALQQRGALARSAKITVKVDGKLVESRSAALADDDTRQEVVNVKQAKAGLYRYDIEAAALPGEVTEVNNHATLMLRVVDEPVRVALLEGKPYWDTKFLVRTLAADPSVELTSVVRMAEGRFLERRITRPKLAQGEPSGENAETEVKTASHTEAWEIKNSGASLLEDPAALRTYQVVVLGRDAEVFLTEKGLVELKKWLRQGDGSLVCFRGPPSSQISQRLNELLPVKWTASRESRFRIRLTESGQLLGWVPQGEDENLLTNLPSLAAVMKPEKTKPLAVVLATGAGGTAEQPADPVMTFQPIGNGRVVVLEGAGMWRWAFLPAQFQEHDEVYGKLWRSLTRWLVANVGLLPSRQMALRSDKVTFGNHDVATGTLLLREAPEGAAPPQIELTGEALGRTETITAIAGEESSPAQYRVVFGKLPEGRYQAKIVGAQATDSGAKTAFDVRGNYTERLDVAARPDVMKLIAQRSGGAVLGEQPADELAEQFEKHQAANMPDRTLRTTAWDRWWVLLGVLAAWAVTWGVRRRSGLV